MAIECPEVVVRSQDLCVTFPGGARLCAQVPTSGGPTPLELSKQMMAQCSAVLAPLTPIFDIIGAVLSIKDFAEAVPGLVTNPGAVVDAVANLIQKVAKLASLIPQLSVPLMILGLIDVIIAYLSGVSEALQGLAQQAAAIADAAAIAEEQNLDELRDAVACADEQLAAQLANLKAGSGPVDDLIAVINTFIGLVPGLPEIPTLGDIGEDVEVAAATVADLVDVLATVRAAIPV